MTDGSFTSSRVGKGRPKEQLFLQLYEDEVV